MKKHHLYGREWVDDRPERKRLKARAKSLSKEEVQKLSPVHKDPQAIRDFLAGWSLLGLPGLLLAISGGWGFPSLFVAGLVMCFIGTAWKGICPLSNEWVKNGPSLIGVYAVISAIVSIFIPMGLMLVVAVVAIPFAINQLD